MFRSRRRRILNQRLDKLMVLEDWLKTHSAVIDQSYLPEYYYRLVQSCQRDLPNHIQWNRIDAATVSEARLVLRGRIRELLAMKRADMAAMQQRAEEEWQAGTRYGSRGSGDDIPSRLDQRSAYAHRLLGNEQHSQILSVEDPITKELKADSDGLKKVLHSHYQSIFTLPHRDESKKPAWHDKMFAPKPDIDPRWYDSLMSPVTIDELREVTRRSKWVSAPGHDGVAGGIWKLLIQRSHLAAKMIICFINTVLKTSMVPTIAKQSIITPIPKKVWGGKGLDNIRPISLQSALYKLVGKVITRRLGSILTKHPNKILHPAQEGFIPGGDPQRCIDLCLDTWEEARAQGYGSYNLFYDIRMAYDCVRHDDILLALRRIRLPEQYIQLVKDQLSDLTACVRTVYGDTDPFSLQRSVPQGGPESPLWYIFLADVFHTGVAENPLAPLHIHPGIMGARLAPGLRVTSKGYADDAWITASSLPLLALAHRWVTSFCDWLQWRLHSIKTKLCGMVEQVNQPGLLKKIAADRQMKNEGPNTILIEGSVLVVTPVDEHINYLGAMLQMNGKWKSACQSISHRIYLYCQSMKRYRPSLVSAIYIWNQYLVPKLEYAMKSIQPSKKYTQRWNGQIVRVLSELAGIGQYSIKSEAWVCAANVTLPSMIDQRLKVTEPFIRLNSRSLSSDSARIRFKRGFRNWNEAKNPNEKRSLNDRLVRTRAIARSLNLHLVLKPPEPAWMWPAAEANSIPAMWNGRSYPMVPRRYNRDRRDIPHPPGVGTVSIYCNGSAVLNQVGGWSILVDDSIYQDQYSNFGTDKWEKNDPPTRWLRGIPLISGHITKQCNGGSAYEAVLRSILEAIQCTPYRWNIRIMCNNDAAIAAVNRALSPDINQRHFIRMAGRPLLNQITVLHRQRVQLGGSVTIERLNVGEESVDPQSVAGRLVTWAARFARKNIVSLPPGVSDPDLPLIHLESHVGIEEKRVAHEGKLMREEGRYLTGDIKRLVERRQRSQSWKKWSVISISREVHSDVWVLAILPYDSPSVVECSDGS